MTEGYSRVCAQARGQGPERPLIRAAKSVLAVVALGCLLPACSAGHVTRTASVSVAPPLKSSLDAGPEDMTVIRVSALPKARPVEAGWTSGKGKEKAVDESAEKTAKVDAEDGGDGAMENIDIKDPFETPNRLIFAVNDAMDVIIFKPVATTYDFWTPEPLKNSLRNVLRNLATPVTLLNDVLQGNLKRAQTTLGRFVLNSTIGFAGLGDPATEMGLNYHYEDFGQTLAVHGVGEGFYLVLPVLGPSSLRHTAGRAVDVVSDPLTWVLWNKPLVYRFSRRPAQGLVNRAELLGTLSDIKSTSVDYYATIRSTYRQNRLKEINNGVIEVEELPDISDLN